MTDLKSLSCYQPKASPPPRSMSGRGQPDKKIEKLLPFTDSYFTTIVSKNDNIAALNIKFFSDIRNKGDFSILG